MGVLIERTVPGTPVTVRVIRNDTLAGTTYYQAVREPNGSTLVNFLSAGRGSEAEARTVANDLWAATVKARGDSRPDVKVNRLKVGVPAGRYAIEIDGVLKFFKIDRPDDGKWKGYTFVNEQAGDELWPVRNGERRRLVTARIGADPAAASKRYGHEIGSCGVCGRTLTDSESRAYGMGPVCRVKMGW